MQSYTGRYHPVKPLGCASIWIPSYKLQKTKNKTLNQSIMRRFSVFFLLNFLFYICQQSRPHFHVVWQDTVSVIPDIHKGRSSTMIEMWFPQLSVTDRGISRPTLLNHTSVHHHYSHWLCRYTVKKISNSWDQHRYLGIFRMFTVWHLGSNNNECLHLKLI